MNYLSHFFIHQQEANHYYNTGLILPDITKKWVKSYKHLLPEKLFLEEHHQLLRGALQHYQADKLFHGSDYFTGYLRLFTQHINNAGLSNQVQRKWFIAHIALELMIDRMLVKYHPTSVDHFYHSLQVTDQHILNSFLELSGSANNQEFFNFFGHFSGVKYIYYYADNNKFMYSLNRIMLRAGVPELGEEDTNKLLKVLLNLENTYFAGAESEVVLLKSIFTNES